jgi:hypothetical protein
MHHVIIIKTENGDYTIAYIGTRSFASIIAVENFTINTSNMNNIMDTMSRNFVDAIKYLRTTYGLDLMTAKHIGDYIKAHAKVTQTYTFE